MSLENALNSAFGPLGKGALEMLLLLLLLLKRVQICDRCSLEYFAVLSRFHSRGPTHDFGSVMQVSAAIPGGDPRAPRGICKDCPNKCLLKPLG